jgi:hypothetical protein
MFRPTLIPTVLLISAVALPAAADVRFLSYDASDRVTNALTRGVTLEVERGLFGAVAVRRIISTTSRGSARIERGGPDEVLDVLPDAAVERRIYTVPTDGDGRPLGRALCPGADQTFLVVGRVRAVRPFTMQAVGRWPDGKYRHCVTLSYTYRGEWALPSRANGAAEADLPPPVRP